MNSIEIKVGTFIPDPPHKLLISAVCAFYEISVDDLFSPSRGRDDAKRRSMLYLTAKRELSMSASDIARAYSLNRQNVDKAIASIEWESTIYLQISCELASIKQIFIDLQQKQIEWLTYSSNTKS